MYLRYTTRRKDGKVHRYWRLVRSVRVGRRVIQQTVAQLGELDARGRLQARALARHLIGTPEQAGLRANVLLLALCQALLVTGMSVIAIASALVGQALAADKSLATLPLALQQLAVMMTALPASLLMKSIGRRAGFSIGAILGLLGGLLQAE